MSGRRVGVACSEYIWLLALYLGFVLGHSLNLAIQDTCHFIRIMRDMFDTVLELSKFSQYSAQKKSMLLKLKPEVSPETLVSNSYVQLGEQ